MSSRPSIIERPSLGRQVSAEANLAQIYGALTSSKFTVKRTTVPSHITLPSSVVDIDKVDFDSTWPELSFAEEEAAVERWTNIEKQLLAEKEAAAEAERARIAAEAEAAAAAEAARLKAEEERILAEAKAQAAKQEAETRAKAAADAAAAEAAAEALIEARAKAAEAERQEAEARKAAEDREASIAQMMAVTGLTDTEACGRMLDMNGGDVTTAVRAFFNEEEDARAMSQARALAETPSPRQSEASFVPDQSGAGHGAGAFPGASGTGEGASNEAARMAQQQERLARLREEDAALAERFLRLGTTTRHEDEDPEYLLSVGGETPETALEATPRVLTANPFGTSPFQAGLAPSAQAVEPAPPVGAAVVDPFRASNPFVDANPFPPSPRRPATAHAVGGAGASGTGWGLDGNSLLRSSQPPSATPPPDYPSPPQYPTSGISSSPPLPGGAAPEPPMAYDVALGQPSPAYLSPGPGGDKATEDKVRQLMGLTQQPDGTCRRMLASKAYDLDRTCNAYFNGEFSGW